MGFHTGNYTISAFIAEMVADLVATVDFILIDNAAPTDGFCIQHVPSSLYVRIAKSAGRNIRYTTSTNNFLWTGIEFSFSTGYDAGTHAATGTIHSGAAPLFGGSTGVNNIGLLDDTQTFAITYYTDRFGLVAAIENLNQSQNYRNGLAVVLEFVPVADRTYADGYTPVVYSCKIGGYDPVSPWSLTDHATYSYLNLRPFFRAQQVPLVNIPGTTKAFRSVGDGKIYFDFPTIHNTTSQENQSGEEYYADPVVLSKRFFFGSTAGGLTAGDAVTWTDNSDPLLPVDRSFILCEYKSSLRTDGLLLAVPYANAYPYTVPGA